MTTIYERGDNMITQNKIYITASEIAGLLGVSTGHAYKIIRKMNGELQKNGYLIIAGKCSRKYFNEKFYGYENQKNQKGEN